MVIFQNKHLNYQRAGLMCLASLRFRGFEEDSLTIEKFHGIQVGSSGGMGQSYQSPKKWVVQRWIMFSCLHWNPGKNIAPSKNLGGRKARYHSNNIKHNCELNGAFSGKVHDIFGPWMTFLQAFWLGLTAFLGKRLGMFDVLASGEESPLASALLQREDRGNP